MFAHVSRAQSDSLSAVNLLANSWKIKKIRFDKDAKINDEIRKSEGTTLTFTKEGKVKYDGVNVPPEQWKLDWKNKRILVYTFMDKPQQYKIIKLKRRKMLLYLNNKTTGGFTVTYKAMG